MTTATSRRLDDGRFEVTMKVTAHKSHADEREIPIDEPIEVGIFAIDPDATENVLHLAAHPLHSGLNTISVIVAKEPAAAVIDPYITRIDRNRFDNQRPVTPTTVPNR